MPCARQFCALCTVHCANCTLYTVLMALCTLRSARRAMHPVHGTKCPLHATNPNLRAPTAIRLVLFSFLLFTEADLAPLYNELMPC